VAQAVSPEFKPQYTHIKKKKKGKKKERREQRSEIQQGKRLYHFTKQKPRVVNKCVFRDEWLHLSSVKCESKQIKAIRK
jgi:hypothetical protein